MDDFEYRKGTMHCGGVALSELAAAYGTPLYVYSKKNLLEQVRAFKDAFRGVDAIFAYAVKANSNLNILRLLGQEGFGGDVVSGGELRRCQLAGMDSKKIVFSGVGKAESELILAAKSDILSINAESLFELELLAHVVRAQALRVDVSLRLNFDIHAQTSDKIKTGALDSKFGIPIAELPEAMNLIRGAEGAIQLIGVACHVGSQILNLTPMTQACQLLVNTAQDLRSAGFPVKLIDVGGGLGIRYRDEQPPSLTEYAAIIKGALKGTDFQLVMEPGRAIVGNAGVAVTRVMGVKTNPVKNFVVVDAAMNDLPRHALYGSYHEVQPVMEAAIASKTKIRSETSDSLVYDVVGPVCETGDILARSRILGAVQRDDLLVVRSCGAYCASMASNYNSRPIAAEVLVDDREAVLIRSRQSIESLWAEELTQWN